MTIHTATDGVQPVVETELRPTHPRTTTVVERVLALGGLAWAILFATTFALAGEEPPASAPIGEIRDYFVSWPAEATVVYGLAGIGLAGYLSFVALRLIGATERALATLAILGATVFVILQTAGDAALLSLTYHDPSALGTEQARTMLQLHETSHLLQAYFIAVFVGCAGIVALKTKVFARWLGWASLALGAVMLIVGTGGLVGSADFAHDSDAAMTSFVAFIIWVGATSVAMALMPRRGPTS